MTTAAAVVQDFPPTSFNLRESDPTSLANWGVRDKCIALWQATIDQLFHWRRFPNELAYDGIEPPTAIAIETAIRLCRSIAESNDGIKRPALAIPSGEGGVVLELREAPFVVQFEIFADGSTEFVALKNNSVVVREMIQ